MYETLKETIMSDSQLKSFDSIDDLFASSLDDLADLASFEVPPKGAYVFNVTTDIKKINDDDYVEASFEVVETVELEDKDAAICAVGTKFNMIFAINNEFGVGKLKKFLAPFGKHFGTGNVGELVRDHVKSVTVAGVLKHRKSKNDEDKVYADVQNLSVA